MSQRSPDGVKMPEANHSEVWRKIARTIALFAVSKKSPDDSAWAAWSWSLVEAVLRDAPFSELEAIVSQDRPKS